ncbi:multidrug resistance protein AcrB/AcrD/AcrF [Catenovulum agarivorans DS-2]|uniref:Multidrug resistance protein AcrB/AcrD/AcrF n=1 Tax=Catenovulum agarivorans DS-2 TaxID=1328313 RepID=W7QPW4_9ALTE|nr:efflux RND transporter permease subunit [Catenovulum agarivorans]EWH11027.1 multidrug resistance protein AcrB/AcrD/AcrF [Catenovulum agarivorans DS-2]
MIAWFAKNDIAANLLMACLLLAGAWSLVYQIPQQVLPKLESEQIEISVRYPAAVPSDVELKVTTHIESALRELAEVAQIHSQSRQEYSHVIAKLHNNVDVNEAMQKIQLKINAINTLPHEIDNPKIQIKNEFTPVLGIAVYGEQPQQVLRRYSEQLFSELATLPELRKLLMKHAPDYEISIEVPTENLQKYRLSFEQIANAIAENAQDLSAGYLYSPNGDIIIRSQGQAYTGDALNNIVVKYQPDGSTLKLHQVAQIDDGFAELALNTRFNGYPAVFIEILQTEQQNAIRIAQLVKEFLARKQENLPEGIFISHWSDNAERLKNRISGMVSSAVYGSILVLLMLTLFLRPAVAFWVFLGIPLSFLGAFAVMPFFGVSLNLISMFGFILVLGMVVDDAIVTGENVYSHLEHAESGLHAAIAGTKEVAQPVTLGLLTTVVAFIPLFFVTGTQGIILSQIAAVVIPVLLFSLIETKWVLPARLKFVQLQTGNQVTGLARWQQKINYAFAYHSERYYRPALSWCIEYKFSCLVIFFGFFLVVVSAVFTGENKFIFFPKISSDQVKVVLTMPAGTNTQIVEKNIQHIQQQAQQLQANYIDPSSGLSIVRNIVSVSGAAGDEENNPYMGYVSFDLMPAEQHNLPITSLELEDEWRSLIGPVIGAESLVFESQAGKTNNIIDIRVSGENLNELQKVAQIVKTKLATIPYVEDVADNYIPGRQQLFIELTPLAKSLGVTRSELLKQVRAGFWGIEVQRIIRHGQEVKVKVRLPLNERSSLPDLQRFMIHLNGGKHVPLSQLANFTIDTGPQIIRRVDHQRSIDITADFSDPKIDIRKLNNLLEEYLHELAEDFPHLSFKLVGESSELKQTLESLKWGILAALIVIYGLLAIPFKSYIHPLIVMSVIPFSVIGSMAGHWLMSIELTMMSFIGLIALVGVVVNDAVVLVEFINKQYHKTHSLLESVMKVTSTRLRPVMLTSMTTFLGLFPLIIDGSSQAAFLVPMAVSLGFGILFAPFVTLFLVPINYLLLQKCLSWWYSVEAKMTMRH